MSTEPLRVLDGGRAAEVEPRTFDVELEASVVGNAVYQPDLVPELVALVRPEMFYLDRHSRIFEVVVDLAARQLPVDVTAIASELKLSGRLAQVGGMPYLTELATCIPVLIARHVIDHGRRVRDLWVRRAARDLGRLVASRTEHDSADTATIISETRAKLDALIDALTAGDATGRVDAIADRVLAELLDAGETPGRGMQRTGFEALDRLTSGLPRDLAILAALPGEGKTALATAIAVNVARTGRGVLIASLETPREVLLKRIVAADGGLDVQRVIAGALSAGELPRFLDATKAIRGLPIFIEHDAMTPRDLWARCRSAQLTLHGEGDLALVVVDYLQLLRPPARRVNRHEEVADVARALKNMAVELRVPVLALAQVNASKVEGRPDPRPRAGDLAESGEIRKCARLILGLHRPDAHVKARRDYRPTGVADVEVLKNNSGASGGVARLHFDGPSTRFSNAVDAPAPEGHAHGCRCTACPSSSATLAADDDEHSLFARGYVP
jgi:replicative DNA helicase